MKTLLLILMLPGCITVNVYPAANQENTQVVVDANVGVTVNDSKDPPAANQTPDKQNQSADTREQTTDE